MLDWHFKTKTHRANKFDENVVRVAIGRSHSGKNASKSISCKFGKNAYNNVTSTEYVVFAIDLSRKRLYFKESNFQRTQDKKM